MSKKYSKKFCRNLDMNLGRIIADALKAYKEHAVPVPADIAEHYGMDKGKERWHKMLDDMIWSFEESANGHENAPSIVELSKEEYDKESKEYNKRVRHGRFLFADRFGTLWI